MAWMHTSSLFLDVQVSDMSDLASNHRGRQGNSLPRASAPATRFPTSPGKRKAMEGISLQQMNPTTSYLRDPGDQSGD